MLRIAKAFIILGMICGFFLIFPFVIGLLTLKKMKKATKIDELQLYGILNIIFVSAVSGILLLVAKQEDLDECNHVVKPIEE